MLQVTNNIISVTEDQPEDIPDAYRPFAGDMAETLEQFKEMSSCNMLIKYPNFQYGGLNPSFGWVSIHDEGRIYRQEPFIYEKYRTIAAIKLANGHSYFQNLADRLQQIETNVQRGFPEQSNMTIMDSRSSGFCPALGERGCRIVLCETKVQVEDKDELQHIYFLVCHSALPDHVINASQEKDRHIQNSCAEYEFNNGIVRKEFADKASPCTFREQFERDSDEHRLKKASQELCIRNLLHYCQLTGLEPARQMAEVDTDASESEYRPYDDVVPSPSMALFDKAIAWWPKDAIMTPFSRIPDSEDVEKELRGYNIGVAVDLARTAAELAGRPFDKVRFDPTIYTIEPSAMTTYNMTRLLAGQLYNYNNCAPVNTTMLTGKPIIVERGLDRGYEFYNYNPITDAPIDQGVVRNDYGNGMPVVFPYKKDPSKEIPQSVVRKFFTKHAGGTRLSHRIPAQLKGGHQNIKFPVHEFLPNNLQTPVVLTPLHTFLSPLPPPGPIYSYDN